MKLRRRAPCRRQIVLAAFVAFAMPGCGAESPSAPEPAEQPEAADQPEQPESTGAEPESIRLSMHAVRLAIGEDTTIIATLHDSLGHEITDPPSGYEVTWATSAPAVATVANGFVRAVGGGRATVTAAAASLPAASVDVEVPAPEPLFDDVYQATTLGRLGGTQSNAWDINDNGIVVGWSGVDGGRAFRWSEAEGMTGLPDIQSSRGINNEGAITGHTYFDSYANWEAGFTAYVFQNGVRTDLKVLEEGTIYSDANQINEAGTVVGKSGGRAVVWRRGDDGSYGPPYALGYRHHLRQPVINGRGNVAFTANDPLGGGSGANVPVLWRAGADGSYSTPPLFLGCPASTSCVVHDINDAGLIVGFRWTGTVEMAVLWHPSDYFTPIDLGVGEAWGINNHGRIVGVTGGNLSSFGGVPRRPAVWTVDASRYIEGPFDIGTPDGFDYAGARKISDDGWIVGSAWGPGEVMATLWRPEP